MGDTGKRLRAGIAIHYHEGSVTQKTSHHPVTQNPIELHRTARRQDSQSSATPPHPSTNRLTINPCCVSPPAAISTPQAAAFPELFKALLFPNIFPQAPRLKVPSVSCPLLST